MISDVLHIMSEPEREGVPAQLRHRGAASWAAATGHPMVHEIGAGTLPHATFRRYFEQNILYLKEYARSIALIGSRAPDLAAPHLLSVGALGACAAGLTAVLPCQWSYGELAGRLMAALPADQICADWIALFGNANYSGLVRETTGLLDRLCAAPAGPDADHLAAIFDQSTRYELQFWDMAYGVEAPGGATRERE